MKTETRGDLVTGNYPCSCTRTQTMPSVDKEGQHNIHFHFESESARWTILYYALNNCEGKWWRKYISFSRFCLNGKSVLFRMAYLWVGLAIFKHFPVHEYPISFILSFSICAERTCHIRELQLLIVFVLLTIIIYMQSIDDIMRNYGGRMLIVVYQIKYWKNCTSDCTCKLYYNLAMLFNVTFGGNVNIQLIFRWKLHFHI